MKSIDCFDPEAVGHVGQVPAGLKPGMQASLLVLSLGLLATD